MKQLITIILLMHLLLKSYAQENSIAQIEVLYTTKHMKDTTLIKYFTTDFITLHVSKKLSKYYNYELWQIEQNPTKGYPDSYRPRSNYMNAYFNYHRENKLFTEQVLAKTKYYMQLDYPTMNWEIDTISKKILGYNCQKAITYFKGRNYTAWFCLDLPYSSGPWKFCGLPGLILAIEDERKQVSFIATEINDISQKNILLEGSKNSVKTNLKDYQLVLKAYEQDPLTFIENEFGFKTINPPTIPKRKKINNPIELSEN